MKKISFTFLSLITVFIFLISCTKTEGTGGTSKITGKINLVEYNDTYSLIENNYPAKKKDVYIIYGDNKFYNDKIETQFDGTYEFSFLRKGKYTIFAYSDDTVNIGRKVELVKEIEITENHSENVIEDINIITIADNEGNSSLFGKVYKVNYNSTFTIINEEYFAPDETVYISYGNDRTYFDKVKTYYNGTYEFENLKKGIYHIFSYSKDSTLTIQSGVTPIIKTIEISENGIEIEVPTIRILN